MVDAGLLEDEDQADAACLLVRYLVRYGFLPHEAINKARALGRHDEQRRIVDEYIKRTDGTRDTSRRADIRQSMDVSPNQIVRWAARLHGSGYLSRKYAPSTGQLVLAALRASGAWMTRADVALATGISRDSMSWALRKATELGADRRRRAGRGGTVWEYRYRENSQGVDDGAGYIG